MVMCIYLYYFRLSFYHTQLCGICR